MQLRHCKTVIVATMMLLLAGAVAPAALAGSSSALQVKSCEVDGDRVQVTVVNNAGRAHAGDLTVQVVTGRSTRTATVKVQVNGNGQAQVTLDFGENVDGVVSLGLTDNADPW